MKTKYNPETAKSYWFNQDGSRAVMIDKNGNRETLPVSFDGVTIKNRAVKYWEMCGNFAFPNVRQGDKVIPVYPNNEIVPTVWLPYGIKHKPQ